MAQPGPRSYIPLPYDGRAAHPVPAAEHGRFGSDALPAAQSVTVSKVLVPRRVSRSLWVLLWLVALGALTVVGLQVVRAAPPAHAEAMYRVPSAHVAARFAHRPTEFAQTQRIEGVRVRQHLVGTSTPLAMVVSTDLPRALPASAVQPLLHAVLRGMGASAPSGSMLDERALRFHGHPARQATLGGADGSAYTVLVALYPRRAYLLLAPVGPGFGTLRNSFETI